MRQSTTERTSVIPWPEALRTFGHIGLNSFGGPAGQIAVMHRVLVEEKKWLSESRFLHALNYCMLLPGPEAMQLVTYVGWLVHRTLGGLVAGVLFVLPGFVSILVLSILYAELQGTSFVQGLFFGIKPAVLVLVIEAVLRIGKKALKNGTMVSIAVLAFVAIFFLEAPFPLIVLAAGAIGLLGGRLRPERFVVIRGKEAGEGRAGEALIDAALGRGELGHAQPVTARTVRTLLFWLLLWLAPVALLWSALGRENVFVQQAVFFSKAAVVTFGGAYSVLSYIAQKAVEVYGWLRPGEMLDGLGMCESTPGPLIQVVQFVGFLGAHRAPGALSPLAAGFLASLLVTWVTYAPCFLWIFVGAPYIEALRKRPALSAALSTITAAVVGVVLNLGIWFALHTLFAEPGERHLGRLRYYLPDLASVNLAGLAIALVAAVLLLRFHVGMLKSLGICALLGMGAFWIGTAAGCTATSGATAPPAVAPPSAGPPALALGFDEEAEGAPPPGWRIGGTHQEGPFATWQVVADPGAPTPPRVLALSESAHGSSRTFNLCWSDALRFHEGALELAVRAERGEEDQGGGPMWRVQDADNYYVCRVNPLESNFRVYVVKDGQRKQLASARVETTSGTWHRIRVEHEGERIRCALDGEFLLEATDATLPEAGGVGLWTKADACTSFDDLRLVPR